MVKFRRSWFAQLGGGSNQRNHRLLWAEYAYAYHISENQPFMDGNKRVALADALVFLEMNGISLNDPEEKLLKAMHMVANKKLDKSGLAEVLKDLAERTS